MTIRSAVEPLLELVSRHIVFPVADVKNGSDRLAEAKRLRSSQWFGPEKIRQFQDERLRAIVKHTFATVPFYERAWANRTLPSSGAELCQLPLLRKRHLREHADELISRDFRRDDLLSAKTGGSTGQSLQIRFTDGCRQHKNAAAIRSDEWAGWRVGAAVAALWGNPPVDASVRDRIRTLLHERFIYLDTMLLNDDVVGSFTEKIRRSGIRFLFGHAHSIYRFCESIERQKIEPPEVHGIVSTSMMLLAPERELIERVLHCPVTDRYGCEEVGLIASQCEKHTGYHVNEEHLIVELVNDDGTLVMPGEPGLVCVTDLLNFAMPLIRYVVEDVAVRSNAVCSCGRAHALIDKIIGRTADFLKRQDGGLVAGVSLVERTLTAIAGIDQLQLIQETLSMVVANVVADSAYTAASEAHLVQELRDSMGDGIDIVVRRVTSLRQEANGKYRFAICRC